MAGCSHWSAHQHPAMTAVPICPCICSVRKETDAQRLRDQFVEYFTPMLFDVTDEVAVHKAATEVRSHMKKHTLLGLVNNAGAPHIHLCKSQTFQVQRLHCGA